MTTAVYVKMDAHDQLLLFFKFFLEGVCRQLGILQYHPSVKRWRGGKKRRAQPTQDGVPTDEAMEDAMTIS